MQSSIVRAASAHWNTIQYSTSDASTTVLHHVTFKVTQGKPGLNITKQISVECKVCTCVAMPHYKCLIYTGCWGGGQKNR